MTDGKFLAWIKQPVVLLFFLTLLVRLFVINQLTASPHFDPNSGDMKFYNDWALRILHGKFADGYAFYGLPGYPFLMAGIYKLFGYNPFFLSGLQAIAEGLTVVFIYRIAGKCFSSLTDPERANWIGAIAALGYVFFVPAQTFSVILMPTSLLVATFWGIVWWSIKERADGFRVGEVLGVGLLIGMMAMIVATIFFIIPIAATALLLAKENVKRSQRFVHVTLLLAFVVVGCSPAILYNRLVAHDSVSLSAHSGLNFFIGNNAEANGYPKIPEGLSAGQAGMLRDSITIAEKALRGSPSHPIKRSAVSAYWSEKASRYIRENPLDWFKLLGQKIKNFWNSYQYDDLTLITMFSEEGITTPGIRFGWVSSLGLAGMLAGVAWVPRSRWVAVAILLHMASLLTVFVTERYRMAAVPGLLIFDGFFLVAFFEKIVQADWKRCGVLIGSLAASAAFVTMPPNDRGIWALESFNSGLRDLENNRLERAEKKLSFALASVPNNDEVNFAMGNLYFTKGDNQLAKTFFRSTLECNPRHTRALNNLAYMALEQKMPDTAVKFLRQSLDVDESDPRTHYLFSQAFFDQGDATNALLHINRALEKVPDSLRFSELKKRIEGSASVPVAN